MTPETDNDLLGRVKNALLSMASASFGSDDKLFCSVHTVNIPPVFARAAAACERAVSILKMNLLAQPETVRGRVYGDLVSLFRAACENLDEASGQAARAHKVFAFSELSTYYHFLRKTAELLYSSFQHQMNVLTPEPGLKDMLKRTMLSSDLTPDDMQADMELRLIHALSEFVSANENVYAKAVSKFRRLLPRPEAERYQKAYEEYVRFYSSAGAFDAASSAGKISDREIS